MESVIYTSRLKLTLIEEAKRGSPEFGWLHQLRSNKESTFWSLSAPSETPEDTERITSNYLPTTDVIDGEKPYRVVYAVHKFVDEREAESADKVQAPTDFVGLVNLVSCHDKSLPLPEHLSVSRAAAAESKTLVIEIAYMFLPAGWGKGYATEAIQAILKACRGAPLFWSPFTKVYVRSIVNSENPKSQRVMEKTGMTKKGVYEWSGDPIFIGGRWRKNDSLHIYGTYLFE